MTVAVDAVVAGAGVDAASVVAVSACRLVTATKCAVTSQLGVVTCVVELPCWCG